jgi:hypothetical protein
MDPFKNIYKKNQKKSKKNIKKYNQTKKNNKNKIYKEIDHILRNYYLRKINFK